MKPLSYYLIIVLLSTPILFIAINLTEMIDAIGIGILLIVALYAFAMYKVEKYFEPPQIIQPGNFRSPEQFIEYLKKLG